DGAPCLVMEYVEGETLEAYRLRRGPLPTDEVLALLRPLAEAVAYLHERGVVHRDLKPDNVKVTPDGDVKLLDFGVARADDLRGPTVLGDVVGTPAYLAPEQAVGQRVDARADVWALGVVGYELLTGRLPFAAASLPELYAQIARAQPIPLQEAAPHVPAAVAEVLMRCLRRDPKRRYADARALVQALAAPATPRTTWRAPDAHALWAQGRRLGARAWGQVQRLGPPKRALALLAMGLMIAAAWTLIPPSPISLPEPEPNGPSIPAISPDDPPAATAHAVTIEAIPAAEVYQGGQRVGQTAYTFEGEIGDWVELTLRRPGYQDEVLRFHLSPTKSTYTHTLRPR
ncbi:MAG: serine/threonine-protein kinase, partial [Bacteroidota bacterium]